jgi:hypothetical protein
MLPDMSSSLVMMINHRDLGSCDGATQFVGGARQLGRANPRHQRSTPQRTAEPDSTSF